METGCYHEPMHEADIRSFARRDWAALDLQKARFWAERKRAMTATDALELGDALRRHAQSLRPDWPDAAERAADLAAHTRVAEALRAVPVHGPR
jgi:hypothetical protein